MNNKKSIRKLKKEILPLLKQDNIEKAVQEICRYPARKIINPLFSFLYDKEIMVRWRAVTAMGYIVSELASNSMEDARIIMRRLMWNLNDESGGIGWGSAEAIGEILFRSDPLRKEYSSILISYADKNGNFLEHEVLQRGVLWGIYRLSDKTPSYVLNKAPFIKDYLESKDPVKQAIASLTVSNTQDKSAIEHLENIKKSIAKVTIYKNNILSEYILGDLAQNALKNIKNNIN